MQAQPFSGFADKRSYFKLRSGFRLSKLTFEYELSDRLSLRANPAYQRKSSKATSQYELRQNFDDAPVLYDQTFTFNYDYLSLPVTAKYNVGEK
jgi:hypothetical protein